MLIIINLMTTYQSHSISSKTAQFIINDHFDMIIGSSSFVLAYFFSLWPFWFVAGYFTLKSALYWGANTAEKYRVNMTSSPLIFYLSHSNSNWREFWMALSKVFRRMYHFIAPNSLPPPPMLCRSNTMYDGNDMVYSTSLGYISISDYNILRAEKYNKYFISVLIGMIAISFFGLYYIW
jgi:hypothetical protein